MNEKLEKQLLDRFQFYEARSLWDGKKLNFSTGTSHGDGWYKILYELCEKIEEDLKLFPNPNFHFIQIKEKYGTLHVYTSGIPIGSKIFDYVNEAENKSYDICEVCGTNQEVTLSTNGWWRTLCKNCRKDK